MILTTIPYIVVGDLGGQEWTVPTKREVEGRELLISTAPLPPPPKKEEEVNINTLIV